MYVKDLLLPPVQFILIYDCLTSPTSLLTDSATMGIFRGPASSDLVAGNPEKGLLSRHQNSGTLSTGRFVCPLL